MLGEQVGASPSNSPAASSCLSATSTRTMPLGEKLDIAVTALACLLPALPQRLSGGCVIAEPQRRTTYVVPRAGDSPAVLDRLRNLQVGAKAFDGPLVTSRLQLHAPYCQRDGDPRPIVEGRLGGK